LQGLAAINAQATLAGIRVHAHDRYPTPFGVLPDRLTLILDRVLLVLGRHPRVFRRTDGAG
jgi:hypothetical protein